MTVEITLKCSRNQGKDIVKNGINKGNKQNYWCKRCNRQFIAPHGLVYRIICIWIVIPTTEPQAKD